MLLRQKKREKYVTVPPLRKQKNSDILWDALKEGRIFFSDDSVRSFWIYKRTGQRMFAKAKAQSPERTGKYSKTTREASKANTNHTISIRKRSKTARMENELLRDFLKATERK